MANLLGIDFGTTALKACLFDQNGNRLAFETVRYSLITDGDFIEFPADDFLSIIKGVIDKISANFSVDAISIDTQGETLIVLDKDANSLMNAIIWLDNRAEKQAKEMQDKFGLKKIYELTGQAEIPAGYPAPKIKWLKENRSEVFENADKFLLLEDYIVYKLTGNAVASRSLYSSSLLMNIKTGEYIPEVLDFIGITTDKLPKLVESGEVVGEYNGIKIVSGALDQIAGITGAGVVSEGIVSETTGTCLSVCAVTNTLPEYKENIVSAYYVKKGLYCLLAYAPTAGATLEWFKGNFAKNEDYDILNKEVEDTPIGADGLVCVPHLCGTVTPENNPNIKGAFFGLEMKHKRGHFVRAIMESIAYSIKEYVDMLNVPVEEIRSMGGGAKSTVWCNIKSSVLGKKIQTLNENETACLGSAVFAGVGIKAFNNVKSATNSLVSIKQTYIGKDDYSKLYNDYQNAYKNVCKLY